MGSPLCAPRDGVGVQMKSADAASGPTPQDVARQLELLAAVARRTGNAVIVTDSQQRIEWVNDEFCLLTGYSSEDAVGRVPRDVLQGPDSDRSLVRTWLRRFVHSSRSTPRS